MLTTASVGLAGTLVSGTAVPAHTGWEVYGGDAAGTKHSALTQINRSNVNRLTTAWVYRCDDMRLRPARTIECSPNAFYAFALAP